MANQNRDAMSGLDGPTTKFARFVSVVLCHVNSQEMMLGVQDINIH